MRVNDKKFVTRLNSPRIHSFLYATTALIIFDIALPARAQQVINGGASETVNGAGGGTQASPWSIGGYLYVGNSSDGTLNIENGGTVSNTTGLVGRGAGSNGTVTVTGAGSSWTNSSQLSIGQSNTSTGILNIENGGTVSTLSNGSVGRSAGSVGTVTVTGAGSSWTSNDTLYVGFNGTGTLDIENGGKVSNATGLVGTNAGSNGTVTVTGAGSSWTNSNLSVGFSDTGTLNIENGGTVSNTTGAVGREAGSNGTVTVTGAGSSWLSSVELDIGRFGTGTVSIKDGGVFNIDSGAGLVSIGENAGAFGTLNIGGAAGNAAVVAGSLNAANVVFGPGTGKIVFNHTDTSHDFAPIISGDGSVEIYAGTTQFNTNHTYSGDTSIFGGTLLLNGSLSGDTTVFNGGVLGGTGILGNVSIASGGKLSPGNSIGTINTGNLTLGAGSITEIEVGNTSGDSDKIVVTGTVDVTGSTLTINENFTIYTGPNLVYTIIENDGTDAVTGTFSTITNDLAFLTPKVNYAGDTGNDIVLTLVSANTFADLAGTDVNQKAVGVALDKLDTTAGSKGDALKNLLTPMTTSQALQAYTDLAGEIHASAISNIFDVGSNIGEQVAGRFANFRQSNSVGLGYTASLQALNANSTRQNYFATDLAVNTSEDIGYGYTPASISDGEIQFWGGVSGYFANTASDGNAKATNSNAYGVVLGGDKTIGYQTFGAAFGYGVMQVKTDNNLSNVDVDSYSAAFYGQHDAENGITFNGSASYSYHSVKGSRTISNLNLTALSDYVAHQANIQGEVSKRFVFDHNKDVIPFVLGRYNHVSSGAFTETGAGGANLISTGESHNSFDLALGARMEMELEDNAKLMLGAGYSHRFGDDTPEASYTFAGGGSFTTEGVTRNRHSAYFNAGFEKAFSDNTIFFAKGSGHLASRHRSISGNVGFKVKF